MKKKDHRTKALVNLILISVLAGLNACSPKNPVDILSASKPVPNVTSQSENTAPTEQHPAKVVNPGRLTPPPFKPEPVVLGPAVPASGPTLISNKARIQSPTVLPANQASLTDGNGAFAFDLYRRLKAENGNFFYSPYSISSALSMTYAGANGTTAEQMAKVLHLNLLRSELHPAFNWLDSQLNQNPWSGSADVRLNISNAIWGQKDYEFRQAFLDTLAENYGAGLRIQDFAAQPDASRTAINDWVGQQTNNLIKDLLPSGSVTPLTRLVLTNTIYFDAAWKYPFPVSQTPIRKSFYSLSGSSGTVIMMVQAHGFFYTEGDNYQAVELPYEGDKTSMVILLPAQGKFAEVEGKLDYPQLKRIVGSLRRYDRVSLTVPKFEFDSSFSLASILSALGMTDAFLGNADFSGISSNPGLHISEVVHKAYISVNETRTVAAGATGATMTGAPPPTTKPITMAVDRPFIFVIRDMQTGTILFIGRIVDQTPLKA